MPRTRSHAHRQKAATVSSQRGQLAKLRLELLAFLDACDKDVVQVDGERSICRVKNVTAKRITKPLLREVAEVVVAQAATMPRDRTILSAFATHVLRESVDIVSWKGNVVESTAPEAKRQKRDDEVVRHGAPELVDGRTLDLVEQYWESVGKSRAREEAPREETPPPSKAPPPPPPSPPPPLAKSAEATVPASPQRRAPSPVQTLTQPKPKSSVSKKEAIGILNHVVGCIVEDDGESDLLTACLSVLDRCWPMR